MKPDPLNDRARPPRESKNTVHQIKSILLEKLCIQATLYIQPRRRVLWNTSQLASVRKGIPLCMSEKAQPSRSSEAQDRTTQSPCSCACSCDVPAGRYKTKKHRIAPPGPRIFTGSYISVPTLWMRAMSLYARIPPNPVQACELLTLDKSFSVQHEHCYRACLHMRTSVVSQLVALLVSSGMYPKPPAELEPDPRLKSHPRTAAMRCRAASHTPSS